VLGRREIGAPMNEAGYRRLERHRNDHREVTGEPFKHFLCPILFVDDDAQLMRGHVINKQFKGAPGTWAVQRSDVDNFYGRMFESDWLLFQRFEGKIAVDFIFDEVLYRECKPKLYIAGKEFHYFARFRSKRSKPVPPGFATMDITRDGITAQLCISDEGLKDLPGKQRAEFFISKDLRLASFVSSLKAAHLTMFSLFGYRYAYSAAGRLIGREMLGRFFIENQRIEDKRQVQRNALTFFKPYRFMVNPLPPDSTTLLGSVKDYVFELVAASTKLAWGLMVYVRAVDKVTAVMLPMPDDADALEIFNGFMRNDHEQIHLMIGQFNSTKRQWDVNPNQRAVTWLKDYNAWPLSL
jgi:hypothetical protein